MNQDRLNIIQMFHGHVTTNKPTGFRLVHFLHIRSPEPRVPLFLLFISLHGLREPMTDTVRHHQRRRSKPMPISPKHHHWPSGPASKRTKQKPERKQQKSRRYDRWIIALLHSSSTNTSPFETDPSQSRRKQLRLGSTDTRVVTKQL